ncbi:MAG TPA: ABC transporter permease [Bryobacteraceae bacterium]|jgi:predicted permease
MNHTENRPLTIGLRLYRALARAFPSEFKEEYGQEMDEVTQAAIEPIWRRDGVFGLIRLLADVAVRVTVEHCAQVSQDIRYGLRTLRHSPGYTLVALVSLSLAIAIATCGFSEVNGLILRDIPTVSHPDELIAINAPKSYPFFQRWRSRSDLFVSGAAYIAPVPFGVALNGRTQRTWGQLVTSSYFSTLAVRPLLGSFFGPEYEQPGHSPAMVVSYRFWQEQLDSDPSAIGKTIRVNGTPCMLLGVAGKGFLGQSPAYFAADLWLPVSIPASLAPELADHALERRDLSMFQMFARLQPGVTAERAESALDGVARQMEQDFGDEGKDRGGRRLSVLPGGKMIPIRKQDRPYFAEVLMLLVALVLLIACANIANMMLARAADRRREIAVRIALGAGRWRLIRQLLTENMMVAAAAGVTGFLLAAWLMHISSQSRMPFPMPVSFDLEVDWHALLFAFAVTGLTGLAFGLIPALQATRANLTPALKEGGNIQLKRSRHFSLRNGLMLCQMAGSLTLLLMTGFLGLGIQTTMGVQRGFDSRNLYLISLDPVRDGYSGPAAVAFFEKILDRVQHLPAVAAAALTDTVPVSRDGMPETLFSDARPAGEKVTHWAPRHLVGKDYFETAGIHILAGRGFRKEDEADNATGVVVSQDLVKEYWNGTPAVGRQIEIANKDPFGGFGAVPGTFDFRPGLLSKQKRVYEVVGVAADVSESFIASKQIPVIYFPLHRADYAQPSLRGVTLMVRGRRGEDVIGAVQREVSLMDSHLTPFNARSMTEHIAQFMYPLRSAAWTWNLIGGFGLILAAVGLGGVTAYSVAQRGHEIGIRMALGAQRSNVLGLVMKEGAILVISGTVIGMALTWAGIRLMAGFFFSVASVKEFDPVLLVGAPILLASLALAACFLPARRSMRIDPATALRQE